MKSKRVFDARQAPEAEVEGVRQVLDEAGIEYYETHAGNWGLGNAAIWVVHGEDRERARRAIEAFQGEWLSQARTGRQSESMRWSMVPVILLAVALIAWISYQLSRW